MLYCKEAYSFLQVCSKYMSNEIYCKLASNVWRTSGKLTAIKLICCDFAANKILPLYNLTPCIEIQKSTILLRIDKNKTYMNKFN